MELEKAVTWSAIATIAVSVVSNWVARMRDKDTTKIAQDAELKKERAALDARAKELHDEHIKMLKEQIETEKARADKEKARADKLEIELDTERAKHIVKIDQLTSQPPSYLEVSTSRIEL